MALTFKCDREGIPRMDTTTVGILSRIHLGRLMGGIQPRKPWSYMKGPSIPYPWKWFRFEPEDGGAQREAHPFFVYYGLFFLYWISISHRFDPRLGVFL